MGVVVTNLVNNYHELIIILLLNIQRKEVQNNEVSTAHCYVPNMARKIFTKLLWNTRKLLKKKCVFCLYSTYKKTIGTFPSWF